MPSPKLAHVILNTSNFEAMKKWYMQVLEATVGVETSDHSVCFLRTDESHHRFGIFSAAKTDDSIAVVPPGVDDPLRQSRLHHFSFEHPTLAELLDAHVRIMDSSIRPTMCLNHGPTISLYYTDPDGNVVELFFDTAYTEEQIVEFYAGGDGNAFGATPFDPAEMRRELVGGKPVAELIAWAPPSMR
ncbi:VOC family protein [Streptomyces sp. NPDC057137]|uniref:VOC family protein n=1 Tax=Streptomyces sp. NPDC057137 TaxID=3346030 RepID=UPI00362EF033